MTTLNNISITDLANVTGGRTLAEGKLTAYFSDGSRESVPLNVSQRTRKDGGNMFLRLGNFSCNGAICGGNASDRK
jgi:hypothetical protein